MRKVTATTAAQSNNSKIPATIAVGDASSKAVIGGGAASAWATTTGRALSVSTIVNIIFVNRRAATNGVNRMAGTFLRRSRRV